MVKISLYSQNIKELKNRSTIPRPNVRNSCQYANLRKSCPCKKTWKTSWFSLGVSKEEKKEYYELVKTLGLNLEDRLTSKVGLLSGGQRQALTLLMATLQKPKLLLLVNIRLL